MEMNKIQSLTTTNTEDPLVQKPDEMDENMRSDTDLTLGQAVRQYKKIVYWIIGLSSVVCLWGYDLAVVGAVASLDPFQRDFGAFDRIEDGKEKWIIPGIWLSLFLAMPSLGQLFGAIGAGPLADRKGRKACMLCGAILITIAVLIIFIANRIPNVNGKRGVFLVGKILQGAATALLKITTQTWISETAPVCLRGAMMAVVPAANLVGQLLGALAVFGVNGVETDFGYLLVLGIQWVFCIAPFLLGFILPESPAYLVRQDRLDEARTSIHRLFAPKNDGDKVLADIIAAEEEERTKHVNAGAITYAECFRGLNLRRTGVVIFANFLPPLFGLPLLTSASYFLQQLGMSTMFSLVFLIVGIIVGFAGNAGSTWTLSRLPRRSVTIYSLLLTAAFWAAMGVTGVVPSANSPGGISKWLTSAFMMIIIFICGLGCWSASYTIMSEVSSLRLRAASQSIGGIAAYLASIFTNFVLPFLYNPDQADLKAKTGFVFMGTSVVAAAATWVVVPEMRGRSVVEIDHMFESGVKPWRSAAWVDEKGGAGRTV